MRRSAAVLALMFTLIISAYAYSVNSTQPRGGGDTIVTVGNEVGANQYQDVSVIGGGHSTSISEGGDASSTSQGGDASSKSDAASSSGSALRMRLPLPLPIRLAAADPDADSAVDAGAGNSVEAAPDHRSQAVEELKGLVEGCLTEVPESFGNAQRGARFVEASQRDPPVV